MIQCRIEPLHGWFSRCALVNEMGAARNTETIRRTVHRPEDESKLCPSAAFLAVPLCDTRFMQVEVFLLFIDWLVLCGNWQSVELSFTLWVAEKLRNT